MTPTCILGTVALHIATAAVLSAAPLTAHPRIWITQADLPRLRSWAVPSNAMWQQGLGNAMSAAVGTYNSKLFPTALSAGLPLGNLDPNAVPASPYPDNGTENWESYATEAYAEAFAFASLVDPDSSARLAHARRARNLFMYAISRAAQGQLANTPFRSKMFSVYNRANYWGEAWGTTFDWLQASPVPVLSVQDKQLTRTTFLRWVSENLNAYTAGDEHPHPVGMINNPNLLSDKKQLRWAANNYFTGHARDICLMALSIDSVDDPNDQSTVLSGVAYPNLRCYVGNVTGAWLYQQFAVYEQADSVAAALHVVPQGVGFANGGLSVEGFLYGHALGYLMETLLALHTAGYHDEALSGPQIRLTDSKYWDQFVDGFLSSLVPQGKTDPSATYLGPLWQFATYGDLLRFYLTYYDYTDVWGILGEYDRRAGNDARLQKARWIVSHTLSEKFPTRYGGGGIWGNSLATNAITSFLLFDPAVDAAALPDPRPSMPTYFISKPLTRVLARTDWSTDARWFTFKSSGATINHQNGDAGSFEFFRKGEWLTKQRAGYGFLTPDYLNTLGLQNTVTTAIDSPANLAWFLHDVWNRGGQPNNGVNAGDATGTSSVGDSYVYASGIMTPMYNWPNQWTPSENATDITHASRDIVWVKPDHLVVYDRAESKTEGKFKRMHLVLTSDPAIDQRRATVSTPGGQRFFIESLLPATCRMSSTPVEPANILPSGVSIAEEERCTTRLTIEDTSKPIRTRFLTVLKGADAGGTAPNATLVSSSSSGSAFQGALLPSERTLVLFPTNVGQPFTSLSVVVPGPVNLYVSGLTPGGRYDVVESGEIPSVQITVSAGTHVAADEAGLLFVPENISAVENAQSGLTVANALGQNSPNPFLQSTSCSYRMETPGRVRIEVRDLVGRIVAVLVDGPQHAGIHEVHIDASQFAHGVYALVMSTEEGRVMRLMHRL